LLNASSTADINLGLIETRVNRILRRAPLALLALIAVALIVSGSAAALTKTIRVGDLILKAEGGFTPKSLPKHENAPISLHGGGKISTVSGDIPPKLETIDIEFDRHGAVDTTGLPICKAGQLEARTVKQARAACPGSIVGEGYGHAIVAFAESKPINVNSPITLFNGPPKGRDPTVLAHAYTTYPVPVSLIVPVVIERIHKGVYGYRTKARIPKIAGGAGIPISGRLKIDKKWTIKGKRHSYVNARCETGHLQARVEGQFNDGTFLSGVFVEACKVRG
jgi:hypothetical protein